MKLGTRPIVERGNYNSEAALTEKRIYESTP